MGTVFNPFYSWYQFYHETISQLLAVNYFYKKENEGIRWKSIDIITCSKSFIMGPGKYDPVLSQEAPSLLFYLDISIIGKKYSLYSTLYSIFIDIEFITWKEFIRSFWGFVVKSMKSDCVSIKEFNIFQATICNLRILLTNTWKLDKYNKCLRNVLKIKIHPILFCVYKTFTSENIPSPKKYKSMKTQVIKNSVKFCQ